NNFHFERSWIVSAESDIRNDSHRLSALRLSDDSRQLGLLEPSNRAGEQLANRPFAGTLQNAFGRVTPDRDVPLIVENAYAMVERVDDVTTTFLVGKRIDMRLVHAICEEHRDGGDEEKPPRAMVDQLRASHCHGDPDDVRLNT